MTNRLGAAGGTRGGRVVAGARLPLLNRSALVSALLSARLVNIAPPPTTVAVTVPWSGPIPLLSEPVTTVLLSPVSRLPYGSSTVRTGWVANGWPAVAVAEG